MRKLLTAALSFSAAVAVWQVFPARLWILAAAVAACTVFAVLRDGALRLRAVILAAGVLLGGLWCLGHDGLVAAPARGLDGAEGTVSVKLTEFPSSTAYATQVTGRLLRADGGALPILLRLDEAGEALRPGDTITVSAVLYRADLNYGERTWENTARGIFLRGYVTGGYAIESRSGGLRYIPQYIGRAVKNQLAKIFPSDSVGFVTAMLTGDKGALDTAFYGALRDSGVAHIVAVSGMHVGFLVAVLTALLGQGRRTSLIALPMVWGFVLMTGAGHATLRAGIIQTVLLIAPLFERESDAPTALGAALFFILLGNPYSIAGVGLQLSFLSAAGLQAVTPRVQAYLSNVAVPVEPRLRRIHRWVSSNLAASAGALSLTVPALAFHFGAISLYAPLTNLLIVWTAAAVFSGGFLACIAGMLFLPLGKLLALPIAALVRYIRWVAEGVAGLPMAVLHTYSGYIRLWLAVVYAVFLLYLLYRREKPRLLLPTALLTGLFLYCLLLSGLESAVGGLTVTALDVGQGQSIVLTAANLSVLVDCGGVRGGAAGEIAAHHLFAQGIERLDGVVLTHFDSDHVNGVERLLRQMEVGALLVPERPDPADNPQGARIVELAETLEIPVTVIGRDTVYRYGSASMTVMAPMGKSGDNERGLSVLMGAGGFDVLITGDMSAAMERRLVQLVDLPDIEVLVVGHHGSKYSTSERLLQTVLAEVAIVSVGAENSYGHPAAEILLRLEAYGAAVYRTDLSGHIVVRAGS